MKSKLFNTLLSIIVSSCIIGLLLAFLVFIITSAAMPNIKAALLLFIGIWFVSSLASFLLISRDHIRRKKHIKNRPIEECINAIDNLRESAESAPHSLTKMKVRLQSKNPNTEKAWSWIDPVIEFERRLTVLTASEDTTPEQAEELANEVNIFLKKNKVHYIFFGSTLADLIREKNSKMKKD